MKLSDLKGRAVLSIEGARKVGTIDDLMLDPSDWHIAALHIKSTTGGPGYLVSGDNIQAIGHDAVTVATRDVLETSDRAPVQADHPSAFAMMDSKVVTEGGELLGTISGMDIDARTRRVDAVEYNSGRLGGLFGGQHKIDPTMVVGVGNGIVTVREAARPSKEAGA